MPKPASSHISVRAGDIQNSTVIIAGGDAHHGRGRPAQGRAPDPQLRAIARALREHFSLEELRHLCFDLGIEYEDLPAQTRSGKARELAVRANTLGLRPALMAAIKTARPGVLAHLAQD